MSTILVGDILNEMNNKRMLQCSSIDSSEYRNLQRYRDVVSVEDSKIRNSEQKTLFMQITRLKISQFQKTERWRISLNCSNDVAVDSMTLTSLGFVRMVFQSV